MEDIKSIAITGATSSIGVFVIQECIKRQIAVHALCRSSSANIAYIPDSPLVHKHECDLASMETLHLENIHCDAFLHLAWGMTKSIERNMPMPQVENIRYTLNAVDLAERLGCHTFVGAGSQAEYGEKSVDLTEDMSAEPTTAYGIAKLCSGQMSRLSCRQKGIRHIWLRILSSYGPCSPRQSVLMYSIREWLNGRVPQITDGSQIWNFVYHEDTARAIMALLDCGRDGEVYLIGAAESRPLKEYLLKARDAINPELPVSFGAVVQAATTAKHLSADIGKIKRETGWNPQISFEEGIKRTIDWMKRTEK